VGTYRNERTEELRRVALVAGRLEQELAAFTSGSRTQRLLPLSPERFLIEGTALELHFRPAPRRRMQVIRPGRQPAATDRFEAIDLVTPPLRALAAFIGTYHSEDIASDYRVIQSGGALVLVGPDGQQRPLQPTYSDAFLTPDGWTVRFHRDRRGGQTRLDLTTDRIRRMGFRRER
jgi:hypothetical protein